MLAHPNPYPDTGSSLVVVDGYGVSLSVQRGHLLVRDGIGPHRRERRFSRATCKARRILILGHAGTVSLEALRWCLDLGVSVAQIDAESGVVFTTTRSETSVARLRRVQALAAYSEVGVEAAHYLLGEKIRGQISVAKRLPGGLQAADEMAEHLEAAKAAVSVDEVVYAESLAAGRYWQSWATISIRFDHGAEDRVPEQWRAFGPRTSPISRSTRHAINPANALLNYLYALLEAETTIALHAAGLDPTLGIWHHDSRGRDSLSLDVMEPARPAVDAYVLDLVAGSTFRARDFHETPQGVCRILPPLTHVLADALPALRGAVEPHVRALGRILDRSIDPAAARTAVRYGKPRAPEHLRRSTRRERLALPILAHCRDCGAPFPPGSTPDSPYCARCLQARTTIVPANRVGKPNRVPITQRRRDNMSKRTSAAAAWNRAHPDRPDPEEFRREILPRLDELSISAISRATGLSRRYIKLIRDEQRVPHPMHWDAFRGACGASGR